MKIWSKSLIYYNKIKYRRKTKKPKKPFIAEHLD